MLDIQAAIRVNDHATKLRFLNSAKRALLEELSNAQARSSDLHKALADFIVQVQTTRNTLDSEYAAARREARVNEWRKALSVGGVIASAAASIPLLPFTLPAGLIASEIAERKFHRKYGPCPTFENMEEYEKSGERMFAVGMPLYYRALEWHASLHEWGPRKRVYTGRSPVACERAIVVYDELLQLLKQQKGKWNDLENVCKRRIDEIEALDFADKQARFVARMEAEWLVTIDETHAEVATQQKSLGHYIHSLAELGFPFSVDENELA